jgi:NTE family protein
LTARRSGEIEDVAGLADLSGRKVGLVLGAGGLVGLAYHTGVLRALERVGGVIPNDADLIVGSSAGSVVGAYLRSGMGTEELWQMAKGTHPSLIQQGRSGLQTRAEVWAPMSRDPFELGRRILGSTYILARSVVRVPSPRIPAVLQHLFPAGMFSMAEGRRRLREELPASWPERPLWLCAVDVSSGRRVVMGRHGPPPVALPDAVVASCAIPGVYRPVQVGRRTLIDGGVYSSSNLDLAVRAGCDLIIGVVPMAFDPAAAPGPLAQLIRRTPARTLAQEVAGARRRGVEALLIRPGAAEVRLHGIDLMRPEGLDRVAAAAYESAARLLDTERFRTALRGRAA